MARRLAIEQTIEEIKQLADEAKNARSSYVVVEKTGALKDKVEELGRLTGAGKAVGPV